MPADQDCTLGVRRLGSNALTVGFPKKALIAKGVVGLVGKGLSVVSCRPLNRLKVTQPALKEPPVVEAGEQGAVIGLTLVTASIPGFANAMLVKLLKPSRV